MKKKPDYILLKNVLFFYSIFGFFPRIKKIKLLILIILHLVGVISFVNVYREFSSISGISYIGLTILALYFIYMVIFNVQCLRDAYDQHLPWNCFFSDIEAFDFIMKEQNFAHEEPFFKYNGMLIGTNIIYIPFHILTFSNWEIWSYQLVITIIYGYFMNVQVIVTLLVLQKAIRLIEIRYEVFKRDFEIVYPTSTAERSWNVKRLSGSHLLLDAMVKKVNELFGKKIFLIITISVLYLLIAFQMSLLEGRSDFKYFKTLLSSNGSILFCVSM